MSLGERGVVSGSDIQLVVVLQEDGPIGGVEWWGNRAGLDLEISFFLDVSDCLDLLGLLDR